MKLPDAEQQTIDRIRALYFVPYLAQAQKDSSALERFFLRQRKSTMLRLFTPVAIMFPVALSGAMSGFPLFAAVFTLSALNSHISIDIERAIQRRAQRNFQKDIESGQLIDRYEDALNSNTINKADLLMANAGLPHNVHHEAFRIENLRSRFGAARKSPPPAATPAPAIPQKTP